jgi:hypothetical protein
MHDILTALERVLVEERSAIRKLDTAGIDAAASKKIELEARLSACMQSGEGLSKGDRRTLERVCAAARANQLLLVHARACVRGVVSILRGTLPDGYPAPSTAPLNFAAVRVNVTG